MAAPTPTQRAACTAPAGFSGSIYRLNAELLSGMAAQPESWKPALDAVRNGLTVRSAGGFAVMLGLKVGDSLREANGIALTATDDVLGAIVLTIDRVRGDQLEIHVPLPDRHGGVMAERIAGYAHGNDEPRAGAEVVDQEAGMQPLG